MSRHTWPQSMRALWRTVRQFGPIETARKGRRKPPAKSSPPPFPLELANRRLLLAVDEEAASAEARAWYERQGDALRANVEASYPEVFEHEDRFMRYAWIPAAARAKGLVLLLHGHDAFLHLGPMKPWDDFDLLAPWDTFGWNRRGSWWWGEKGDNFVERMVQALVRHHRRTAPPDKPWFCTGGSMGGFGALYHGIKYGCDGIYVMCPQVDLRATRLDFERAGHDDADNPYAYLQSDNGDTFPDLLALAEQQDTLPPLYLTQNQFDPVNLFAQHAHRLVDVYNRKRAWLGLRILPAIGHAPFGGDREARVFFSLIVEKNPPRKFPD